MSTKILWSIKGDFPLATTSLLPLIKSHNRHVFRLSLARTIYISQVFYSPLQLFNFFSFWAFTSRNYIALTPTVNKMNYDKRFELIHENALFVQWPGAMIIRNDYPVSTATTTTKRTKRRGKGDNWYWSGVTMMDVIQPRCRIFSLFLFIGKGVMWITLDTNRLVTHRTGETAQLDYSCIHNYIYDIGLN